MIPMSADEVDTKEFFEICQRYRYAPLVAVAETVAAYEALCAYVANLVNRELEASDES